MNNLIDEGSGPALSISARATIIAMTSLMPNARFLAAAALALLNADPTLAQDTGADPLPTIIVRSRLPAPSDPDTTRLAPRPGDTTLPALLSRTPGLFVDEGGGAGAIGSIHLRGTDPNHTAVLVDGIKLNDPTNSRGGSVDAGSLLLQAVDRVEVVLGALSTTHGADALGGVIAIETQSGTPTPSGGVALTLGDRDHHAAEAALRGPLGPVRASLSGGDLRSARVPSGSQLDARQAVLRLDGDWDQGTADISLRRSTYEARTFPDDSGGIEQAASPELERRKGSTTAGGTRLRFTLPGAFNLSVDASAVHLREDTATPAVAGGRANPGGLPAIRSDNRFDRQNGTAALIYAAGNDIRLLTGLGLEREAGRSNGSLDFGFFQLPSRFDLDRTTRSAFAEAGYQPEAGFGAQAGLRLDRADGHTETTASGGLSWRDQDNVVTANYGEGYKLPSFYALGNPLVGNPGLRPERSRSLSAALTHNLRVLPGDITIRLFQIRIRDIVDFEPRPPPRLLNRQGLRTKGGELSLTLHPAQGWSVTGFATNSNNRFADGAPVRDRPRWQAGGELAWTAGPWRLRGGVRYTGTLLDNAIPTGDVRLGAYPLLDLAAGWTPLDGIDLDINARNVLDRYYQQRVGTPGADRQLLLTLKAGF